MLSDVMDKVIELGNAIESTKTNEEKAKFCESLLDVVDELVEKHGSDLDGLEFPEDAFARIDKVANSKTKKHFLFSTLLHLVSIVDPNNENL